MFIFRFLFHCLMVVFVLFIPIFFLKAPSDITSILKYEIPVDAMPLFFYGMVSFWLWLAMRSGSLNRFYGRFPVFLSTMQMILWGVIVLDMGQIALNYWADDEIYSKKVAMLLLSIILIVGRILFCLWYRRHPISSKARSLFSRQPEEESF